jgi:hypothetical protein
MCQSKAGSPLVIVASLEMGDMVERWEENKSKMREKKIQRGNASIDVDHHLLKSNSVNTP